MLVGVLISIMISIVVGVDVKLGASVKRFAEQTPRIRGSLSAIAYGNPELSNSFWEWACVETRWGASFGMVV